MTQSDYMMMAAVDARLPFRCGGREVSPHGERMEISLCGKPCASVDFAREMVTIHGEALGSRKSAKVFNAILRTYTEVYAKSVHGRWKIQVPIGMEVCFTGDCISVPISREFARQQ